MGEDILFVHTHKIMHIGVAFTSKESKTTQPIETESFKKLTIFLF